MYIAWACFRNDFSGIVAGIECTVSQEERYHRHIEETMREIYPPIIASNYYIHFAPVIGDNGRQQGNEQYANNIFTILLVKFKAEKGKQQFGLCLYGFSKLITPKTIQPHYKVPHYNKA